MNLKKVLIVDDSRTGRILTIQLLKDNGQKKSIYIEAPDGMEATYLVKNNDFDLIVTDLLMPKMDGLTFIKKARLNERNRNTPILIISSVSKDAIRDEISSIPKIYLIQKPLNDEDIRKILGEIHE